ncbi:hypothetical protein [Candidatus Contendibacter odensensis]|nr:hypothetical protein [Candidatus Contendobacter odensis]
MIKNLIFTKSSSGNLRRLIALGVVLFLTTLTALHWIKNPYRLSVWVYASDNSHLTFELYCQNAETASLKHSQTFVAGYFEYQVPVPQCHLKKIRIYADTQPNISASVASASIIYYGKEVARIFGPSRIRQGESSYANETRPSREIEKNLSESIVLDNIDINLTENRILWPRWLPFAISIIMIIPLLNSRGLPSKLYNYETPTTGQIYSFLFVFVLSLITVLSIVARTDVSVHPDELTHVESAKYYYDHWLKPKIGDPETLGAHYTNRYGVAYLTGTDPVYLIAGKFAVFTWPIFQNDVIALRMFNVSLFALLVFFGLRNPIIQLAAIPLLVTPQVWYVFSYFNGDALPLFLSTLAVFIFLDFWNLNHSEEKPFRLFNKAVLAGVIASLIFLSKPNYWAVLGVILLYYIVKEAYLNKRQFSLLIIGYMLSLIGVFWLLSPRSENSYFIEYLPLTFGALIVCLISLLIVHQAFIRLKNSSLNIKIVGILV